MSNRTNDAQYSAESSSAQQHLSLHPDPDVIEHIHSSANTTSSSEISKPEAHRQLQEPYAGGSTSGSSQDEIGPVGSQHATSSSKKRCVSKYGDRYDLSEYNIEQVSEYDDIDIVKPWHRKLILIHPLVIVVVFAAYSAYYGYRVWCNYQYRLVRGGLAEASWIFICVEGIILCKQHFAGYL
jgi:hypothetical protein